ncbi:MAG TPA: cobalamin-binding protein [Stellaceae bacterium]|nr:cobalamin-binding protein [Stellaceae bacterium]
MRSHSRSVSTPRALRPPTPARIVCLTAETVETLYLLDADARIAGVTGYAVRPAEARRKPRVAAFTTAHVDRILALKPDLVLGFSDLQAEIVRDLVKAGIEIHVFNQRDIAGILAMIRTLGRLVGTEKKAENLASSLAKRLAAARKRGAKLKIRPRVYFEEWDEPAICGIRWVSELIEAAGGEDVFAQRAHQGIASERLVSPQEIVAASPDIVIGSWCGKKFRPERFAARPGFARVPAVRDGQLHEIKSAIILQPGPGALTLGLDAMEKIIRGWRNSGA